MSLDASMRRLRRLVGLSFLSLWPLFSQANTAMDSAVAAVCDKDIVALGEDLNHGAGGTLALRSELLLRLVRECGFRAVAFESPVYDFLDYRAAARAGRASEAMLLDALGGLWSVAREIDILTAALHAAQVDGKVQLLGLDHNLGGATHLYSRQVLPPLLAAALPAPAGKTCEEALLRHTHWRYTAAAPFDDTARDSLQGCAKDLRAAHETAAQAAGRADTDAAERAWMARNLESYFAAQAPAVQGSRAQALNLRAAAFEANLRWHLTRLAPGTRIILWVASVHGARSSLPGVEGHVPLGMLLARNPELRFASIGFSALNGQWGRPGQPPRTFAPASPTSIEALAFSTSSSDPKADPADAPTRWLSAQALKDAGVREGRALNYAQPHVLDWSLYLDGVLVLRNESPLTPARPARPQQAPR